MDAQEKQCARQRHAGDFHVPIDSHSIPSQAAALERPCLPHPFDQMRGLRALARRRKDGHSPCATIGLKDDCIQESALRRVEAAFDRVCKIKTFKDIYANYPGEPRELIGKARHNHANVEHIYNK